MSGNTLLYPVSVSNFSGPDHGIFCISIIDINLRSALVLFSLLRASNYHNNKGTLKVECFKWKTIHSRLLCISVQQSIVLRWFITVLIICIIARYTWRGTFAAFVHLPTNILLFVSCFILNCLGTFLLSKILNLFICGSFNYKFLQQSKKSTTLDFWSRKTSAETKFLFPKPINHLNTEYCQGSADHGEEDFHLDINFLVSGNTLLYPVSVSYCPGSEQDVFCISIIGIILRSALVLFSLLRASNYHNNKGTLKVEFFKLKIIHSRLLCISVKQSLLIWWFINIFIIFITDRYTCGGIFAAIFHWPTTILLFLSCFLLNYHGTFIFSQILTLFICGTFKHNLFAALKEIHNLWFEAATTSA